MKTKIVLQISILCLFWAHANVQAATKKFPEVPKGQKQFRAYYSRLNYTDEWEKSWRVGGFADVLVTFDDSDRCFFVTRIFTRYFTHVTCLTGNTFGVCW